VKEFLSQRGVVYTSRDVSSDPIALEELSKFGYMTTPVTTIDGQVVVGFDQKRLAALLGSN
jgi:glutaredoxin 3